MQPHPNPNIKKNAKERLLDSAKLLFPVHGADLSLRQIANHAETNEDTAIKYFGDFEGLLGLHLDELIHRARGLWSKAAAKHSLDEESIPLEERLRRLEATLRDWIVLVQAECLEPQSAHCQIARLSAQLGETRSPLGRRILEFRQRERQMIADDCELIGFRDASALAGKLMLLIDGARNERKIFGFYGCARKLASYADDLMNAHRYSEDDDPPLLDK